MLDLQESRPNMMMHSSISFFSLLFHEKTNYSLWVQVTWMYTNSSPLPMKRHSCLASPCFSFFFMFQPLTANKSMLQIPIVFVPRYKNMCKQNALCNLGMQTGTKLPKSFNLTTEQLGCNYNILTIKGQLLVSPGRHQIARPCSCPDLKILIK